MISGLGFKVEDPSGVPWEHEITSLSERRCPLGGLFV